MQAIVQHAYGTIDDVLRLQNIDEPTPRPHEVFVRVHAASGEPRRLVAHLRSAVRHARSTRAGPATDRHLRTGPGRPVKAVGEAVTRFHTLGADVTGVCSTRNIELVRSLGADHVINYTRGDFTRSRQRFDLIVDLAARHPLAACRSARVRAAKPSGQDLATLTGVIEAGQVTPVIEKTYALAETSEAIRHLAEQPARAKVVIAVHDAAPQPSTRETNDA